MNPLHIDLPLLISQMVTFLLFAFVVWKFAWKPLLDGIRQRQDSIKAALDNAEQTRQAIAKLEEDYRLRVAQIQQKSAELVDAAKIEAGRVRDDLVRAAHKDAEDLRKRAEEQIAIDRRQLTAELRGEIVQLSMAVAAKALGGAIDEQAHRRRFEDLLGELEATVPGSRAS